MTPLWQVWKYQTKSLCVTATNVLAYCNTVKNYNCKRFEVQAHEKEKEGEENKKLFLKVITKKYFLLTRKFWNFRKYFKSKFSENRSKEDSGTAQFRHLYTKLTISSFHKYLFFSIEEKMNNIKHRGKF